MAQAAVLAIRIVGNTRDAQGAIKSLQKDLGRLQASLKMTAKAFAAASVGKSLASALGAVGAAAAAGGLALGAFGVAAAGQVKTMQDVSSKAKAYADAQADMATKKKVADRESAKGSAYAEKAQKQYASAVLKTKTAQQAWLDSTKGIPKETASAALAFAQLKTAYQSWSDSMAPTVMPLFTQALNIAKGALSGLTPLVTAAAGAIKPFLDRVQAAVDSGAFANWAKDMSKIGGPVLKSVLDGVANLGAGFADLLVKLGPAAKGVGDAISDLTAKFKEWSAGSGGDQFAKMAKDTGPALTELALAVAKVITAFSPFAPLVLKLVTLFAQLINALPVGALQAMAPVILALVAAWRVLSSVMLIARLALVATQLALVLTTAATAANTTATTANSVATRAAAVATRAMAIAQRVLNVAMRANMIGIIITLIIAFVAAIILAYKKSETFRGIVQGLWGVLKAVGAFIGGVFVAVWNALKAAIGFVINVVKSVINWFRKIAVPAALAAIKSAFNKVKSAIGWVIDKIKSVIKWLKDIAVPSALSALKNAFDKAKSAAQWLIDKVKSLVNWLGKLPGGGVLSKVISKFSATNPNAAPTPSVQRSLAATRSVSARPSTARSGLAMATHVYVSIDGQQLQGRITKTVNSAMNEDGMRLIARGWA